MVATLATFAQTYTGVIKSDASYTSGITGSTGFTLTNTDTVDVVVTTNRHGAFTLDATLKLDSISGNPTGTLYVLGRKDASQAWAAIANQAWTTNDATVVVSHTTAVRYRYLLLRFITGGTGVTKSLEYSVKTWIP